MLRSGSNDGLLLSTIACTIIAIGFLLSSDQFYHWFIFPVLVCGIVIGVDAVNWLRGRISLFNPIGIIGLIGVHFFFLAPLLQVSWDFQLQYVKVPEDWRPWLGGMAILNALGLLVYRVTRQWVMTVFPPQPATSAWQMDNRRFPLLLGMAMAAAAGLQLWIFQKFGGIAGYVAAAAAETRSQEFEGLGILFLLSESFPILVMIGFAVYARMYRSLQNRWVLLVALMGFLLLQLVFGGLRGSRSNTVFALLWATGILHFWVRPISRKAIAIGIVFLMLFMYLYGFYKSAGIEGVQSALEGQEGQTAIVEKSGRNWQVLVLQDFGRSDIQAFLLYRLLQSDNDYEYALGRTYVASASILLPKLIFPNRLPDKRQEGTNLQYGMGSYQPGVLASSKVYGLAGETLLNFGPLWVPFMFAELGIIVGLTRRCLLIWNTSDARFLLLPMMINLCFVVLTADSDNVIFFLIKNGAFPFAVLWLGCSRKTLDLDYSRTLEGVG